MNRGFRSGDVESLDVPLSDIGGFIDSLNGKYDRIVLVGLSWGGKLALTYTL